MPRWLPNVWGGCCPTTETVPDDDGEPSAAEFDLNNLLIWAMGGNYELLSITLVDETGVPVTANIGWPDGSTGTYQMTYKDIGCNMANGYILTHSATGATVTQPLITRDGYCNPVTKPALVVSGYTPISPPSVIVVTFGTYDTADDVRAAFITAELISVGADDNGDAGLFVRSPTSSAADDGANVLVDAAGIRFLRRHHV